MLTGLHFLLTYACNFECDHCFLCCGPNSEGTFTLKQVKQVLAEAVETLRSFVQVYNSVTFETPEGFTLRLLGLGERVEVSQDDRAQLATFGAELAAAVW